jgi:hypothetical protein
MNEPDRSETSTPALSDLLALGCMGVLGLFAVGTLLIAGRYFSEAPLPPAPVPVAAPMVAAVPATPARPSFPAATLTGPDGAAFSFPPSTPTLVNVWLQGCSDCMDAFEAHKKLVASGSLPKVPVVNVAYGNASAEWAAEWAVSENLVLDRDGKAIVHPLGIGTFTTFLVGARGEILFRGRPGSPGFLEELTDAAR